MYPVRCIDANYSTVNRELPMKLPPPSQVLMCDYRELSPGVFACAECGDRRDERVSRICQKNGQLTILPRVPLRIGTALKIIIATRYKVPPCHACHETAHRMDTLGPAGCRENLADLAEQLQSNASRLNWTQLLAAAMHPVSTTTGAIQAYREGLAFYERLILDACEMVEASQQ